MHVIVKLDDQYWWGSLYWDSERATLSCGSRKFETQEISHSRVEDRKLDAMQYLESDHDLEIFDEENWGMLKIKLKSEDCEWGEDLVERLNGELDDGELSEATKFKVSTDLMRCKTTKNKRSYYSYKLTVKQDWFGLLDSWVAIEVKGGGEATSITIIAMDRDFNPIDEYQDQSKIKKRITRVYPKRGGHNSITHECTFPMPIIVNNNGYMKWNTEYRESLKFIYAITKQQQ